MTFQNNVPMKIAFKRFASIHSAVDFATLHQEDLVSIAFDSLETDWVVFYKELR